MNALINSGWKPVPALLVATALGLLSCSTKNVVSHPVKRTGGHGLSCGEKAIAYGGVTWRPWRMLFEVQGDRLVAQPKARPGFNYGHAGNGRGPQLYTNIGNQGWRDFSMQCRLYSLGVSPQFNPYGLPPDYRSVAVLFHVADARESWNEQGLSAYFLTLGHEGNWSLEAQYGWHCAVPVGWGNSRDNAHRVLAKGDGVKLDPIRGNRLRVDVQGTRIQIWLDDRRLVDLVDDQMAENFGGMAIDHGGVGFLGYHDALFAIGDFKMRRL